MILILKVDLSRRKSTQSTHLRRPVFNSELCCQSSAHVRSIAYVFYVYVAWLERGRTELGNWTWEKPEVAALKSPTGPPLIRLDKAQIKTTRCDVFGGLTPLRWLRHFTLGWRLANAECRPRCRQTEKRVCAEGLCLARRFFNGIVKVLVVCGPTGSRETAVKPMRYKLLFPSDKKLC